MDIRKSINTVIAAALAVLAVAACKKEEDETETLPSFSGQLSFEAEPYIKKGVTLTLKPAGPVHPEGKGIGYYWAVPNVTENNDTTKLETDDPKEKDGTAVIKFPDEIGTYTVSCTAFASGYYSTTSTRYVTVVDREESLIDMKLGYDGEYGTCRDGRDGISYRTVKAGSLEWFAENLRYSGNGETGIAYENAEAMSDLFGRYYSWEEATDSGNPVCPEGWRIPTSEDWLDLANAVDGMIKESQGETSTDIRFTETDADYDGITGAMMVDAKFNSEDNVMWEYWPDVKITNLSGLSIIPCGFANLSETASGTVGTFDTVYLYAAFWSAESEEDSDRAYFRYIYWDTPVLQLGTASSTDFAATVRCVRDI